MIIAYRAKLNLEVFKYDFHTKDKTYLFSLIFSSDLMNFLPLQIYYYLNYYYNNTNFYIV